MDGQSIERGNTVINLSIQFIGNSVVAQSVLAKNGREGNDMIGVNVGFALAIAFGVAVCAKLSGEQGKGKEGGGLSGGFVSMQGKTHWC